MNKRVPVKWAIRLRAMGLSWAGVAEVINALVGRNLQGASVQNAVARYLKALA